MTPPELGVSVGEARRCEWTRSRRKPTPSRPQPGSPCCPGTPRPPPTRSHLPGSWEPRVGMAPDSPAATARGQPAAAEHGVSSPRRPPPASWLAAGGTARTATKSSVSSHLNTKNSHSHTLTVTATRTATATRSQPQPHAHTWCRSSVTAALASVWVLTSFWRSGVRRPGSARGNMHSRNSAATKSSCAGKVSVWQPRFRCTAEHQRVAHKLEALEVPRHGMRVRPVSQRLRSSA